MTPCPFGVLQEDRFPSDTFRGRDGRGPYPANPQAVIAATQAFHGRGLEKALERAPAILQRQVSNTPGSARDNEQRAVVAPSPGHKRDTLLEGLR